MEVLDRFGEAAREQLHLRTSPIAIKFLEPGEPIPQGMGRPLRDLGVRVRPCKAWNLVRQNGLSIAMLEDDFSTGCPASLFMFGIMEPVQPWLDGDLAYGIYAKSREAAVTMEKNVLRLEVGAYKGILLAPLERASFVPDLVMMYCNSQQAMRLVSAAMWTSGEPLRFDMAARGLCSDGVVQPFQIGRPVLAVPCGGDRAHGGTQDDELVFTAPLDALEGIVEGLRAFERTHSTGKLGEESELRKKYNAVAQILDRELGR